MTTNKPLLTSDRLNSKYRPDIDGLRAVAVLAVIFYHFDIFPFLGGFTGVDVFFVISGFLITGIILPKLRDDQFSLLHFYERRVRRIFPALFAMLLVCSVLASWLLVQNDRVAFGESLIATTLFVSNHYFLTDTGYFSDSATNSPLLHTWSLAVEEQFYILFPFYLIFVKRFFRARYVLCTAGITLASLLASIWFIAVYPDAAFYLAILRAWEIGIGALLAMIPIRVEMTTRTRNIAGTFGFALIMYGVFAFSPGTAFPGANALIPAVGAGLVIWAGIGGTHLVGRVLQSKILVGIGLISYPLYLWHWPLLVFAKYGTSDIGSWKLLGVLVAAFVLSIISYYCVELPVRSTSSRLGRRGIGFGAFVLVFLGLLAGYSEKQPLSWLWQRFDPQLQSIIAAGTDHAGGDWPCWRQSPEGLKSKTECLLGDSHGQDVSFVLWGDSHAGSIAKAISDSASAHGRLGKLAVKFACPPLLTVVKLPPPNVSAPPKNWNPVACRDFNNLVLNDIIDDTLITDVILAARWATYTGFDPRRPGPAEVLADAQTKEASSSESRKVFERLLPRTIRELRSRGKRVWILASIPEIDIDVPATLFRARRLNGSMNIGPTIGSFLNRQEVAFLQFEKLADDPSTRVLYPHKILCDPIDRCHVMIQGKVLYYDDSHLTWSGADQLIPLFDELF